MERSKLNKIFINFVIFVFVWACNVRGEEFEANFEY